MHHDDIDSEDYLRVIDDDIDSEDLLRMDGDHHMDHKEKANEKGQEG